MSSPGDAPQPQPDTPGQSRREPWPLWSTRPQDGPLDWYIQVPDTLRTALAAGSRTRGLQPWHVPGLVAMHALLPHRADRVAASAPHQDRIIRPRSLAAATGIPVDTLRALLAPGGALAVHATRVEAFSLDDEGDLDVDPTDDGKRWLIRVVTPVEGAWMRVPAWWLLARAYTTLRSGRVVERRIMRSLTREHAGWVPGPPGSHGALMAALMVIERTNFKVSRPRTSTWAVPTLARRWGLGPSTAHRYFAAAEVAGYLASDRRSGGNGIAAERTVVMTPDQAPGVPLAPDWGKHRTRREPGSGLPWDM